MNPLLKIVDCDKYVEGRGEMLIKLLGLIPVAEASTGDRSRDHAPLPCRNGMVSHSCTQLPELGEVSENQARATMTYGGQSVSGCLPLQMRVTSEFFRSALYGIELPVQPRGMAGKSRGAQGVWRDCYPLQGQVVWNLTRARFIGSAVSLRAWNTASNTSKEGQQPLFLNLQR